MSNLPQAQEVISRALQEMVREIAQCGSSGGVGRVQNYAPVFNNLYQCMKNLNEMLGEDTSPAPVLQVPPVKEDTFAQRMIAARAAKKSVNK